MKKIKLIFTFALIAFLCTGMNVKAQGTYALAKGDSVYAGQEIVSVPHIKMTYGGVNGTIWGKAASVTFSDPTFTAYTAGDNNNPKDAAGTGYSTSKRNLPVSGTYYMFKPDSDGVVTVAGYIGKGKYMFFTNSSGVAYDLYPSGYPASTTANTPAVVSFNVYAGQTFYLLSSGSKLGFGGFTYKIGGQTAPTEVTDIASFVKAGIASSYKLTLTNTVVKAVSGDNIYVQDASGALCLYKTGFNVKADDVMNGTIYGSYTLYSGIPEFIAGFETFKSQVSAEAGSHNSPAFATIKALKDSATINKLIGLTNAKIVNAKEGVSKPYAYAVQGSDTIKIYDSFGTLGITYKFKKYATSIVGIMGIYNGEYEIFPFDSTSIVSPSYANPLELCVNGNMSNISSWTVKSAWSQNTKGSYPNFSKPFMEAWVASSKNLADNYAYQIARNLPEGLYILKGAINAVKQLTPVPVTTGVKFYMNSDSLTCSTGNGAPEIYTLKKTVSADSIKFGIDIKTTNANWVAWDDVSLTYYGDSATYEKDKAAAELAIAKKVLIDEIAASQIVADDATYKYDKTDLNAAIATANTFIGATDLTVFSGAAATLKAAKDAYKLKAACYAHPYDLCVNGTMVGSNNSFNGWTLDANASCLWKVNNSSINNFNDTFMETWMSTVLPDKYAYQIAKNLPKGLYILKGAINACQQKDLPAVTGVKFYMNSDSVSCSTGNGVSEIYTISKNVEADSIKFGINIKSTNANWFAWDNISLTYYGDSITYEMDRLAPAIAAYMEMVDSAKTIIQANKVPEMSDILRDLISRPMPTTGLADFYASATASLKSAITTANAVISGNLNTLIINADGSNGSTGWKTNMSNASGQRYDNKTTTYFDKWNASSMNIYANQTVQYLPAGKYTLTVASRGAVGVAAKVFANSDSVAIKTSNDVGGEIWTAAKAKYDAGTATKLDSIIASANNVTGRGWSYDTIQVTLKEPAEDLTLGFIGSINNTWASFTDWTLTLDKLITKDTISIANDWIPNTTNALNGWTNDGFSLGTWAPAGGYVNGHASCQAPFLEKWVAQPGKLPNATIQQTLTNLPNGEYQIGASFIATQQGVDDENVTGAWFFANNDSIQVATGDGIPELFGMNIKVVDGTLNFGFKTRSTTANWIAFDNIELNYIGVGDTIINREKAIVTAGTYQGITATQVENAIKKTLESNTTCQTQFNALVALKVQLSSVGTDAAALDTLIKLAQKYYTNSTVPANATKDAFEAAITTAQSADVLDLPNAIKALQTAINQFITSGANPINDIYFDMTNLITNAKLETLNTGWSIAPSTRVNCSEVYNTVFDLNQTIEEMPVGNYELGVTAFHRQGFYNAGIETVAIDKTNLYANENTAALKSLYYTTEGKIFSNGTGNYANSMEDAKVIFDKGLYINSLIFATKEAGNIKIGIKNDDTTDGNWTIFRDFTLKFWGTQKVIPTNMNTITQSTIGKFNIYNIAGQRIRTNVVSLEGLSKGLYIINGKKVVIK
jgi:hypothetical protein